MLVSLLLCAVVAQDSTIENTINQAFTVRRELDDWQTGHQLLLDLYRTYPNDYRVSLGLGEYYLEPWKHSRDLERARDLIAESLTQFDAKGTFDLGQRVGILQSLAYAHQQLDENKESVAALDEVERALNQAYSMAGRGGVLPTEILSQRAWSRYKQDDYDGAWNDVSRCLMQSPSHGGCANIEAILLSVFGEYEQSIRRYRQLLDNGGWAISNNLGETYRMVGRYPSAIERFEEAMAGGGSGSLLSLWNYVVMRIQALELPAARNAVNAWVTQNENTYRLEENRGLIALMRAQIAYYGGFMGRAFRQIEIAESQRQNFGSIGFSPEAYDQALKDVTARVWEAWAYEQETTITPSPFQSANWGDGRSFFGLLGARLENWYFGKESSFQAWWRRNHAFRVATKDLKGFDDLFTYNPESMMDYSRVGDTFALAPHAIQETYLDLMREKDRGRQISHFYFVHALIGQLEGGREPENVLESNEERVKDTILALLSLEDFRVDERFEKALLLELAAHTANYYREEHPDFAWVAEQFILEQWPPYARLGQVRLRIPALTVGFEGQAALLAQIVDRFDWKGFDLIPASTGGLDSLASLTLISLGDGTFQLQFSLADWGSENHAVIPSQPHTVDTAVESIGNMLLMERRQ